MSARDRTSLDGRVALVTGSGSSEGIGFAAARIMGARVQVDGRGWRSRGSSHATITSTSALKNTTTIAR